MAEEEVPVAVEVAEEAAVSPVALDHKRKLEDLEAQEIPSESAVVSSPLLQADPVQEDSKSNEVLKSSPEVKRPRLVEESDGSAVENGHETQKLDVTPIENDENQIMENIEVENTQPTTVENLHTENVGHPSMEDPQIEEAQEVSVENLETVDEQHPSGGDLQQRITEIPQQQQGDISFEQQQQPPLVEVQTMSRKMEVPNNKVGVLIGKAGDTIRFLQFNSGAKIQITRDAEADPYATTRPVELIGTLENINKAEKLIKDVIAEADAGGSPSLVARGFGTVQASGAAEQIHIQVPNEKVGLIIGKGGETIKNLQTRSGARIQLIPQHLPEGDQSKERTVRVTGDKKQIEMAREMIKEVMNQPVRPSPLSSGYNQQQTYRPRGPTGPPQWGPRAPHSAPTAGHDYQQRGGMYPSQNPQYPPPPTYGGYPPQQPPPRSGFNAGGWDQRPSGPVQAPQSGGYDYYGQGGSHVADAPPAVPVSSVAPAPASAPTQVNYNYGQPHGPDYGQPSTYSQSAPPQQSYGHGYDDPKYGNQVLTQPNYGGHGNAQPGAFPQQVNTQSGYPQQPPYTKPPTYGMPSQGPPPQTYGPPRSSQPGDVPYQGPQSTHAYGSNVPSQQTYPYASSGPTQQTYPYGVAPTANDGYNQPSPLTAAPGYGQPGGQPVSGYGQPGGQPAPGYAQVGQSGGGYGSYGSSQPVYGEQPVTNNVGYGYQGPADSGYNSAPTPVYGAPPSGQASYAQPTSNQPSGQASYVQPTSNQPSYDQPMPQSGGYGGVPGSAPVGYVKNLSPQPGYAQYDSTQMYGAHH